LLHEYLSTRRTALIERCLLKATQRAAPKTIEEPIVYGIPLLLDQIITTLKVEQTSEPMQSRKVSGPSNGGASGTSEIGATARLHAHELLRQGYTVERVVHDYGDLCQAITDLAFEEQIPIQVDEFRTLNRCLDNAIADSVTEYTFEHEQLVTDRGAAAFHEHLGIFAHELRNLLTTATHALAAMKTGQVGLTGPTGAILGRSLIGLQRLIDRSLADVRLGAPIPARAQLFSLADFVADVERSAALEAQNRGCVLVIAPVHPRLAIDADREMLFSAATNLLLNAVKFTRYGTEVSLNAYGTDSRILIEVKDHCGGLPPGDPEHLFHPFTQSGDDKSGVGLGLSICRRSVEANHGTLSVRDVPGAGCVFTIDLPLHVCAEKFFRV
jgi:signal transduction histidine kinase